MRWMCIITIRNFNRKGTLTIIHMITTTRMIIAILMKTVIPTVTIMGIHTVMGIVMATDIITHPTSILATLMARVQ